MLKWTFLMSLAHYRTNIVQCLWLYIMLPHTTLQPTSPSFFFLSFASLTQLFHSASGVDLLILARQRGKDTDGTLLVNHICKSKLCLFLPHVFSCAHTSTLMPFTRTRQRQSHNVLCVIWCYLLGIFYVVWSLVFFLIQHHFDSTSQGLWKPCYRMSMHYANRDSCTDLCRLQSGQTNVVRGGGWANTYTLICTHKPHPRLPLIKDINRCWASAWLHLD